MIYKKPRLFGLGFYDEICYCIGGGIELKMPDRSAC